MTEPRKNTEKKVTWDTVAPFLQHRATAIFLPPVLGLAGVYLAIVKFEYYGWSLFLLLPIFISFLSSFCWSFQRKQSFGSCYGNSCLCFLVLGILIAFLGIDGFICLLMALPLALFLALIGVLLGKWVGYSLKPKSSTPLASFFIALYPLLIFIEQKNPPEPVIHRVTSSVEIDADVNSVWDIVIAFPEMQQEPKGVFRYGIAYPRRARIEGMGVGAVRYCTFTTGDFVEPITRWEKPHHLAFDVVKNPPIMKLPEGKSIAHMEGYLVSRKGEFRLFEKNGKVVLQGSTWYSHSILPRFYWRFLSDAIIQDIHLQVLNHIKQHAEKGKKH